MTAKELNSKGYVLYKTEERKGIEGSTNFYESQHKIDGGEIYIPLLNPDLKSHVRYYFTTRYELIKKLKNLYNINQKIKALGGVP